MEMKTIQYTGLNKIIHTKLCVIQNLTFVKKKPFMNSYASYLKNVFTNTCKKKDIYFTK